MKKLLFVCIENSNRSQMAQAFANIYGTGSIQVFSAGSRPRGTINPKAVTAMKELSYDLSAHSSKSIEDVSIEAPFDIVVTMGCGDACPWLHAKKRIDWQIPDPGNMDKEQFNVVRDQIGNMVKNLIDDIEVI